MDHFRPYLSPRPMFDGYYSKFDLPSGGHLILIICTVPSAATKAHLITFNYFPPTFPSTPAFMREIWAKDVLFDNAPPSSPEGSFKITIPDIGYMTVHPDNSTDYEIIDPSFTFTATVPGDDPTTGKVNRTPWIRGDPHSTPVGPLVHLPLPLHWHIHTLASDCTFTLKISPSIYTHIHPLDKPSSTGGISAIVHQEKNYGDAFPFSHIWIRGYTASTKSAICLAGVRTLGVDAYLITYHAVDPAHDVSFGPPFALSVPVPFTGGLHSATMSSDISWDDRTVKLRTTNLTHAIEIKASAPKGTFLGLTPPFEEGHKPNLLAQSHVARLEVKVSKRVGLLGLGGWETVCEEVFEPATLEFAGDRKSVV